MKNNTSFFGLFLAILVFLPGCIRVPVYHSKPLKNISESTSTQFENSISLYAKVLTAEEIQHFFGSKNKNLIEKTTIIQFSIHNQGTTDYILNSENITMKTLEYKDVVKLIKKTNTTSRFAGATVCGFLGSPLFFERLIHFMGTAGIFWFLGSAAIALPLGIVFLAEGIKSAVINRRIKKDMKEKMIHKKIIIKSGQHYEGLIFVLSSAFKPAFTMTMHEKKNTQNNVVFNVNLNHV